MSKQLPTIWELKPHSIAKHSILKAYISAWVSIVGQKFSDLLYVDGFAGPGIYKDEEQGSPIVVIDCINKALNLLKNTNLRIKLCFIDNDFR